jgi:hyperosmotically inducible periplasmic protein
MRVVILFFLAALAMVGCEPIDTSRTGNVSDPSLRTNDPQTPSSPSTPAAPADSSANPTGTPASASGSEKSASPDNSAVNQRDASGDTKTAIDQKETQRDVNITADIRKAVIAAEDMSINARNVKIITEDGKVVLRGPVNTAQEKEKIDKIARDAAGKENVENQIEVIETKP